MTLYESWMGKLEQHYEHCEAQYPGRVWATMLYGSQNYGLANEASDVDSKTMILPTLREVVLGAEQVSRESTLPDGSITTIKDFRGMFKNYLKGNINFVETLYTEYYLVNPAYGDFMDELREHRDLIANSQPIKLLHMAAGMARQKFTAMEKPFESKLPLIEKYGYDPKQLHHLDRLRLFIRTYKYTLDFEAALNSARTYHDDLMQLKTDPLPLEEARKMRDETMAHINQMVERANHQLPAEQNRKEAEDYLDDLVVRMFSTALAVQSINHPDFRKNFYTFAKKIFVI